MAFKFFNKKKDAPDRADLGALKPVSRVRGDWTLATSEALYSAVGRIANAVAMLPLHLYNNYEIATDDYREKLLSYLWAESRRQGSTEFSIPFNRQELADYLCVDRSAMSAELSRMQKDGLLSAEKNRFALS